MMMMIMVMIEITMDVFNIQVVGDYIVGTVSFCGSSTVLFECYENDSLGNLQLQFFHAGPVPVPYQASRYAMSPSKSTYFAVHTSKRESYTKVCLE